MSADSMCKVLGDIIPGLLKVNTPIMFPENFKMKVL